MSKVAPATPAGEEVYSPIVFVDEFKYCPYEGCQCCPVFVPCCCGCWCVGVRPWPPVRRGGGFGRCEKPASWLRASRLPSGSRLRRACSARTSQSSSHRQLERIYKQERAIRAAAFWDLASRRALQWSKRWEWHCSPSMIELGEDVVTVIAYADRKSVLYLASTCRCLRSLLLPRLLEKKKRAVRALYLSGALA